MPDEPEAVSLLALLLLQGSRTSARVDGEGHLVLLADQDRSAWDRRAIAEGVALLEAALPRTGGRPGVYALQAAIAAVHAEAATAGETDWAQIAALYDRLAARQPSPVVRLNRAVAVAFATGFESGLALVDEIAGELDGYHPFHAARADLLRRSDRPAEAADAYRRALALCGNDAERSFLVRRLAEVTPGPTTRGARRGRT
jgi:RNA polymerase sigma-70 factor (ECF subfamily)